MMKTWAALVLLSLAVACASAPPQDAIQLVGSAADVGQLAGTWIGTFEEPSQRHHGTINIHFDEPTMAGSGDIRLGPQDLHLRVLYIRVSGQRIAGAIEPYYDASCSCTVNSSFTGRLEGDRLSGEFVVKPLGGDPITGTWSAARQ